MKRTVPALLVTLALVAAACGATEVEAGVETPTPAVEPLDVSARDQSASAEDAPSAGDVRFTEDVPSTEMPPTAPTGGTPLPDFEGAVSGDDAAARLPLGVVNELPGDEYLDFLFEFCFEGCFRDAHFVDSSNPHVGSGPWTSGRAFHVRHGFINEGDEPLGDGFDVVLYVTPMEGGPSEFGEFESGATTKYTSDFALRGVSHQCGPTYKSQTDPQTCEWFVHDFPDGLPEGRFALWAVWQAPCSYWLESGFTESCGDADEVVSFFSSGVDSPFGSFSPSFTEVNEAQLTADQIRELYGDVGRPFDPGAPIDASGAVANPSTSQPDFTGALSGDDGAGPLPLGDVNDLPGVDYLDFLFEFCAPECYRDAHFMDPTNPGVGSGPWTSGRSFHVRHGFVNNGDDPLPAGFGVTMYITRWGEYEGGSDEFAVGQTYRFTSDYVMRGPSERCGPGYKTQVTTQTCEWFVHDFPDGLPDGRYDLWAVWEAPCSAWVDMGYANQCEDDAEVISLFSSGVNSPFDSAAPSFTEVDEGLSR